MLITSIYYVLFVAQSLFSKSLFPIYSSQVTLFNMLSRIIAGSILALGVGKAIATVQFGGVNIAGYFLLYLGLLLWSCMLITELGLTLVLILP